MTQSTPDRNVTAEASPISADERTERLGQRGVTLWFTGLSASGKSTIARNVERRLFDAGRVVYGLDGDNMRMGLNRDLGFSANDRTENIRRIAEVSRLFNDAGVIALSAFISPFRADRQAAMDIVGRDRFVEIYVSAPLDVCEQRDPKGLYRRARNGEIADFTGIDAPYEVPRSPTIVLHTDCDTVEQCTAQVLTYLARSGTITDPGSR